jgi:hypothetical protein
VVSANGILEPLVGFGTDFRNVGGYALGQFRVMLRAPCPGGKLEGLTLLVASDIPPEKIDESLPGRAMSGFLGFPCSTAQASLRRNLNDV